jgi:hypothetical protein
MRLRPALTAVALAALVPALAACGGGSDNASAPLPPAPTLTVPGQSGTPSVPTRTPTGATGATGPSTTTSATTTPATTTTQANPTTPQGGAQAPQTGGASPNQTQTNTSPPAGSPAQKFEQFCKDNPGAC